MRFQALLLFYHKIAHFPILKSDRGMAAKYWGIDKSPSPPWQTPVHSHRQPIKSPRLLTLAVNSNINYKLILSVHGQYIDYKLGIEYNREKGGGYYEGIEKGKNIYDR